MKLRVQNDRSDCREKPTLRKSQTVMQPNPGEQGGLSFNLQAELHTGTPSPPAADSGQVRVSMTGGSGESSGGTSSRRSRLGSHSHPHGHGGTQHHSNSESELDPPESDVDSGEPSASLAELRCVFQWIQKSLPFLVLLCVKLFIQHALGLAVGVGLFLNFLYVNKNIQSQVFLQDHQSKLKCIWLLLFLSSSTLLLYYTFLSETLYNCLVFLSPTIEPLAFWETLWAVGVTNLIIKFLFMGVKCLILLVPSSLVSCRTQGRWLMLTEELGQVHQATAPVPLWFRYLVTYQESDGTPGLTLGVLLALLYLILKLLGLYKQWTVLLRTVRVFLAGERCGSAATRAECMEAGDVCPICQGEYRDPRVLICQHIFCDECIALWFNREKSCPLCRAVITDQVYRWRDGATSPHLQIY
ncbi:RING finger and transmembrane domain-containing protein 1 [Austrofundulus limnaeus]|uniref:E3 ubiquitin-protein ligase RNFT1 n=2 Tax=Austrofundulus limnaeus TaxID=52670 RepID=A0A2I4DD56_AUSLI|nr:PREDICTED: RING finger and transmembrane domain-containing protein 1-like [Austrofundulus limnaeus]